MTSGDTDTVQPVPVEVGSGDATVSASDRSPLGRERVRWSSRNSSKGALLLESVKCLQFLDAGHSLDELQQAIREKDLLGKRTREARRTYWRLISWRFLMPPESAVVSALAALSRLGADDPVLRGALYFHFCLADRLTFDVATDLLWTLQQQGRGIINVAEVESYIRAGMAAHPEVATWSGRTLKKLASSVLSALRDFGRLAGGSKKRIVQPPLADELLVYVCKFLSAEGKSAKGILEAPDFRLWGLTRQEVGARLAKLSQSGVLRFEWSGDIAVLDLGEEPFDAYARRLGQETH
jgi:BrxA